MKNRRCYKISTYKYIIFYFITGFFLVKAEVMFNPAMLEKIGSNGELVDLTIFESKSGLTPGKYSVNVIFNGQNQGIKEIDFVVENNSKKLSPRFTFVMLEEFGLKESVLEQFKQSNANAYIDIAQQVKNTTVDFNEQDMSLQLSVPQSAINRYARGYVSPTLRDDGITAVTLNYQFSGASTLKNINNDNNDSQYLNLRSGLNFEAWRFRNNSSYSKSFEDKAHWKSSSTYLQRDIDAINSEITLGNTFTENDLFNSVSIRGFKIGTNDIMLPDSQRGFAPIVRGIASSNARVTIKQNGYIIYETYVTPGAFEIDDLYATGGGSDLDIIVKEEDGSETRFNQTFASVPSMAREGHLRYSASMGEYRGNRTSNSLRFSQLSLFYGLPHNLTLYGGAQYSERYLSNAFGIGADLGKVGAISLDATHAKTEMKQGDSTQGQSYRIRYAKALNSTGTHFQMIGYRFSTKGYYQLQDAVSYLSSDFRSYDYRSRDNVQLVLSQNIYGYGSVFLNMNRQRYWAQHSPQLNLVAGYNGSIRGVSYALSYGVNRTYFDRKEQQFSLNLSVPLQRFLPNTWASWNTTTSSDGKVNNDVNVNGILLDDQSLNYNLRKGFRGTEAVGSGIGLVYSGQNGDMNVGYNVNRHQQQLKYGFAGGIVAHESGVSFGPQLGETIALVEAPDVQGVSVLNGRHIMTNANGHAIVPSLMPYRKNSVSIDPNSLPDNSEIHQNSQTVVPTKGAVTRVKFEVSKGYKALVSLIHSNKKIPFGAMAILKSSHQKMNLVTGIVDDQSQVYLSGLPDSGHILISWGNSTEQKCSFPYHIDDGIQNVNGFMIFDASCN
jgi:outer membrane usher protein